MINLYILGYRVSLLCLVKVDTINQFVSNIQLVSIVFLLVNIAKAVILIQGNGEQEKIVKKYTKF
jgi:hypothetical protein